MQERDDDDAAKEITLCSTNTLQMCKRVSMCVVVGTGGHAANNKYATLAKTHFNK